MPCVQRKGRGCGAESRNSSFHVDRPAPTQEAILNTPAERVEGPKVRIAGRDDVGVAYEAKMTEGIVTGPLSEEIVDRVTPFVVATLENQSMTFGTARSHAVTVERRRSARVHYRRPIPSPGIMIRVLGFESLLHYQSTSTFLRRDVMHLPWAQFWSS